MTANFNQSVSNLGWEVKRPEFAKQKSLVINYAVADTAAWDEASVEARARDLCKLALEIWPAPDTLSSASP